MDSPTIQSLKHLSSFDRYSKNRRQIWDMVNGGNIIFDKAYRMYSIHDYRHLLKLIQENIDFVDPLELPGVSAYLETLKFQVENYVQRLAIS